MAQQQFKEECDVNTIIERYIRTGEWSEPSAIANRELAFWDVSSVPDEYADYLEIIETTNVAFQGLPGALRQRFNNNPQELVTWLDNPANKDEAVSLGIVSADYPGFVG